MSTASSNYPIVEKRRVCSNLRMSCRNRSCQHAEGFHDRHGCLVMGCHCTAYVVSETDEAGHIEETVELRSAFQFVAPSARLQFLHEAYGVRDE